MFFFVTDRIFSGSGSQFTAPCIKLYPYIILRLYSLYTVHHELGMKLILTLQNCKLHLGTRPDCDLETRPRAHPSSSSSLLFSQTPAAFLEVEPVGPQRFQLQLGLGVPSGTCNHAFAPYPTAWTRILYVHVCYDVGACKVHAPLLIKSLPTRFVS